MKKQNDLRDELCRTLLRAIGDGDVTLEQAAVACMGAAACVIGVFPAPIRERIALELDGKLLEHANQRAKEIRSGEFDQQQSGH